MSWGLDVQGEARGLVQGWLPHGRSKSQRPTQIEDLAQPMCPGQPADACRLLMSWDRLMSLFASPHVTLQGTVPVSRQTSSTV